MAAYYVNRTAQSNGDHEVHRDGCLWLARTANPEYLGEFSNCRAAVGAAVRRGYRTANGCATCSPECHTG